MLAENYFNTANQLKDSGQLYTAMIAYQKALSIKPDYVEAYKKLAEVYSMQGHFDAAISACKEAVKIQPNFASAYLTLGNIFQSQNLFEQAINTYYQALKYQPNFAEVYANIASVYYKQRQFNLAIFNYQKALAINPKLASVQLMLGNVFAQTGEFDQAVYCYQNLLQIKPEDPKAYFKLAEVFALYTNLEPAFDYYQKSLSIQPNYREAFAKLYKLLKPETTKQELEVLFSEWQKLAEENNQNIKEYIDSVIQEKSTNFIEKEKFTGAENREAIISDGEHGIQPATFNLIPDQKVDSFDNTDDNLLYSDAVEENLEKTGKFTTFEYQKSESEFPKKLLKFPAAEAYINQANLTLKEGNLAAAIASCKQALKIQPDYAPCYVTLGNAFYQQNNLEAALRAYSQGLEIEPEVAEVQGNIGSVYFQLGQYKQALFHYQKAIDLKPGLAGIYWNIGKLFQYLGKVDEALDAWEKALEIQPDIVEADFHFKLGNTLVKLSRINDAVKSYERAINLKPDYTEAYSNLANILGKQGDKEAAAKYYQKALNINSELKHLHEKLANNLLLKGDYDQAIFNYQEAIKYNPNSYDAYANLGTALSNKGLLESALEKYYKALELKPNWAEVYSRIGHIIKQEKMEEAIALFEKAIEVKPKFVEAHQQLCDLLSHTTKLAEARKAADNFCNSCAEIAPILSGTAFLFSYFQSGVSDTANSKLSEVEKICYQSCETFSELEIKLLYEIFLFAVPHLRDDLEGNAKFYKLIAKQYYQNRPKIYQTPKTHTSSSQPLKIGFLSKHFRRHSVGWCSEALIRELSQITPDVHLYITGPLKRDDITQRFEQMSVKTYWPKKYPNGFPSYEEITTQILEDKLDIVVDLDSMTLPVNVHIIHEKPAPVCVSWLGFDAPYISENHYFLCDWHTHPQGREKYYLEKLVRLPETSVAVGGFESRSVDRNAGRNSIGIDSDKMVYLCIAPGRKTNPEMVRAQLKILQHIPESILIRKGQGDVDIIYQTYLQESENLGVDFNRIMFLGQTQTEEEHRAIYQIADVLLDSYPYNGGTHNLEALWQNLPIITRAGEQYLSRMGYSFLQNVNLDVGVAWSWEEYTEWGIKLGQDLGLRNSVREHLQKSKNPDNLAPLWNPKKLAKEMYQVFAELLV
ncbi:tetratricopeptide repeat protein [Dapis sp. BLCC M126]|uniref:tetratricopeptide repeat protein n=1 Tax=Dapis sp. BLCC M126 TaxID=3400189 RepID=UPI003CEBED89